ncbi:hypothetical protein [Streptomyces sp. NPDC058683]|uniref:hypothetical protein n=1 Tax=Streptomyces sp. NPDC058683 TaxID=3346597 RepID=UPI00365864C5
MFRSLGSDGEGDKGWACERRPPSGPARGGMDVRRRRVHSVRTTRRRRAVWWALTALAGALAIGGVVLASTLPDVGVSDVWVFAVVSAILGGILALFLLVPLAVRRRHARRGLRAVRPP